MRARIDPLMTGIGPVEGAVALTAALARLEARGETVPSSVTARTSSLKVPAVSAT